RVRGWRVCVRPLRPVRRGAVDPARGGTGVSRAGGKQVATADAHLLCSPAEARAFTTTDPWRVRRVPGEVRRGLGCPADPGAAGADVGPGVTVFGSARTADGDAEYEAARATARLLGEAGFTIITGGGPGIMEAANRGAREAGALSVGLNIELPFEQKVNEFVD